MIDDKSTFQIVINFINNKQKEVLMKKILLLSVVFICFASTISKAQIVSDISGNWSSTSTWVGGVIPSANDDVVIAPGDTVTLDSPTAQMKNLTIQGALIFNKTAIVVMVVNGNIIIESTGSFKVQTRTVTSSLIHTIELTGNLTHNGSTFDFRTGSAGSTLGVCNLTLSGTNNSTITMSTPYSSTNGDYNAITINKTGGAKVILGSDIYLNSGSSSEVPAQSVLTFVNGLVETGNFTLIHQSTTSANITGASSTSYIYGNLGRGISSSAGASKAFAVGDATNYRPITVRSTTSGGATGHYVRVGIINGDANTGSSTLTGNIDKVSAVRYYKVTYNKGTTATTSMSFDKFSPSYREDDGVVAGNVHLRVAYSTDARVTWNGLSQTVPHTTDLTNPPTTISPDSLGTPFVLNDAQSLYVALARLSGTTENCLCGTVDVEEENGVPSSYNLDQNFPNPFNPSTTIRFALSESGPVNISVYNILGEMVLPIVNQTYNSGVHEVNFNASSLESGSYFYRITSNNFVQTKKMMLIK